jgi:hypothetical protein
LRRNGHGHEEREVFLTGVTKHEGFHLVERSVERYLRGNLSGLHRIERFSFDVGKGGRHDEKGDEEGERKHDLVGGLLERKAGAQKRKNDDDPHERGHHDQERRGHAQDREKN